MKYCFKTLNQHYKITAFYLQRFPYHTRYLRAFRGPKKN